MSIVAWFVGKRFGLFFSILSAFTWQTANIFAGESFSSPFVPYWNAATRLGFFFVITMLLSELRLVLDHERELSRTDFMTGALNSRAFYEVAESEIRRSQRYHHPLAIAYIDLDNFKIINDQFGHNVGDKLLQIVVDTIKCHIRTTDIVARLGGDEFVILLVETNNEAAHSTVQRMRQILLSAMDSHQWPVTFSIGVLVCSVPPANANEMIRQVDQLMYSVKNNGKNGISYSMYEPPDLQK